MTPEQIDRLRERGWIERAIWSAMMWAAENNPGLDGVPEYTDGGNSFAETECRATANRIRTDFLDALAAERTARLAAEADPLQKWRALTARAETAEAALAAKDAEIARLRELVKRARDLLDPCYPQSHLDWQNDARALKEDTP